MKCPKCLHSDSQVLDSRDGPDFIRRRRECQNCKCRFTTYERIELPNIVVIKNNQDRERFEPEKIRRGVRTSCKNTKVTSADIDNLVEEVSRRVYFSAKEEISSKEIGEFVQELLKELDPIAYLRFTSVYKSFHDLKEFVKTIKNFDQ